MTTYTEQTTMLRCQRMMRAAMVCVLAALLAACVRKVTVAPVDGRTHDTAAPSPPCVTACLPIIAYHRVTDKVKNSMTVSPSLFTQHMQYLKDHGYTPVTMEEWYLAVAYGLALPTKPVAITFDDAWADQYEVAAPILARYKFHATFYAYTSVIGSAAMTWDELRGLAVQGHCIGSHTDMHSDLARKKKNESDAAYAARLVQEIGAARQQLEAHLGTAVQHFCYPYGYYNTAVVALLKQAQFRTATTVNPAMNTAATPLLLLNRMIVAPWTTTNQLGALLGQRPLETVRIEPDDGVVQTGATTRVAVTVPAHTQYLPATLRMKWNWKWVQSAWDPATRTVAYSMATPLTPGIYSVQVHAWDARSNHYAHAWQFQQGVAGVQAPSATDTLMPQDIDDEQEKDPTLILLHTTQRTR